MEFQPTDRDIMLDLETLGTKPGCGILAIGACTFDLKDTFYLKVYPDSNKDLNLFTQQDTLDWYKKQAPAVYQENFSGTTHIIEALEKFNEWFKSTNPAAPVWGNGADFDLPILTAAYHQTYIKHSPWKPFNGRCYRTLKNLFPFITIPRANRHTALDDAINQATHAAAILDFIRNP